MLSPSSLQICSFFNPEFKAAHSPIQGLLYDVWFSTIYYSHESEFIALLLKYWALGICFPNRKSNSRTVDVHMLLNFLWGIVQHCYGWILPPLSTAEASGILGRIGLEKPKLLLTYQSASILVPDSTKL